MGDDIQGDGSVMILTCVTHLMHPSLALIYTSAQRGYFLAHYLCKGRFFHSLLILLLAFP